MMKHSEPTQIHGRNLVAQEWILLISCALTIAILFGLLAGSGLL
jgi:hypothetical protein